MKVSQSGPVPTPRAYHSYVTIGAKYLVVFGGSDSNYFFKDWHILNLKTLTWKPLQPSIEIGYCLNSAMVWVNGRGILLANELFDSTSQSVLLNCFY